MVGSSERNNILIKHRALSTGVNKPNSFEALTRANAGNVVEVDVFLLSDGFLGIAHNKDLNLKQEIIENMDLSQFQELNQPIIGEKEATGVKMPLFPEILGFAFDRGIDVQVELKAGSVERMGKLVDRVTDEMERMRDAGVFDANPEFLRSIVFFSMSVEGMKKMVNKLQEHNFDGVKTFLSWPSSEKYAMDMKISESAITYTKQESAGDWFERGIAIAERIGCTGVSIHGENLIRNPEYIRKAQNIGLEVMSGGTVNDNMDIKRLGELGVNRIMSEVIP